MRKARLGVFLVGLIVVLGACGRVAPTSSAAETPFKRRWLEGQSASRNNLFPGTTLVLTLGSIIGLIWQFPVWLRRMTSEASLAMSSISFVRARRFFSSPSVGGWLQFSSMSSSTELWSSEPSTSRTALPRCRPARKPAWLSPGRRSASSTEQEVRRPPPSGSDQGVPPAPRLRRRSHCNCDRWPRD